MRARFFFLFWTVASLTLVFGREPAATNTSLSVQALRAQLDLHVRQDRFRSAQWGIKVVRRSSGETIYDYDSEKLLKPASNAKLFTGALALDVLGPEYRIRTSIFAKRRPDAGVLKGDLVVFGRGDPTFSPAFRAESGTNVFSGLVDGIRQAGIRQIEGDLIGDATFFSGPPFGSGWTWDDLQFYYGAEVTALAAYDNVLDLSIVPGSAVGEPCRITPKFTVPFLELVNRTRTGVSRSQPFISIERPVGRGRAYVEGSLPIGHAAWADSLSVPDGALWFVSLLKDELARGGIIVSGAPKSVSYPERSAVTRESLELAAVDSSPVSAIVERMMTISQNLYAQLLLLQVGAKAGQSERSGATTEEQGVRQLREFASRAGIPAGQMLLDDGAGLSRSGLVSPAATVQLLRYMAQHKSARLFRDSLPQAGAEGTLRNRLKELKGRLVAKTGTIRYVNTLSGYLTTPAGDDLIFSIMLNAYAAPPGSSNRDEVDVVARLLARFDDRAGNGTEP